MTKLQHTKKKRKRRKQAVAKSGMENIDPSALNRQFFQHHFSGQHHHAQQNSYQHSHPFHQHQGFPGNSQQQPPPPTPQHASPQNAGYTTLSSSCSFAPATFSSPVSVSDHVMSMGNHAYPTSNSTTALYNRDSYSESSSPNLNISSGSTGFNNPEHVAPYTPSPSESDSLDQTDSIDSCDPNSMTAVDLDEDSLRRSRHRRRHRHHSNGSPVVQRQAANLRERRRMQSINEAFEVSYRFA